ncbi:hypothetical protein WN943_001495 [Citrus x changshan-huyou]
MPLLLLLFIIITLLSLINVCLFTYDRDERPVEMDCFDLADQNEFALSDFNDEVNEVEQGTAIEDLVEMMATNDDRDVFADECTENNIENDLPHADSEGEGKCRCSGSKYGDDGIASNAASTENMVSTQSSVIGHGKNSEIWADKLSHGRQHLVSPNVRMLVSILEKQAF